MSRYVENSLARNETIIEKARFHWIYSLGAWSALIFLGLFIVGIIIFFEMMIRKWSTEIAVTNQRFIIKTGWLSLTTNEISLNNIEGVRVRQDFWGRIFGFGTVHVEGTGVDSAETPIIADPVGFRRAIENAKYHGV